MTSTPTPSPPPVFTTTPLPLNSISFFSSLNPQLFLEREAAAILAEAKTDDLISEAPKPALDQSGEWKETSGEIQWVAAEPNDSQADSKDSEKKEEEDEELDLNKGAAGSAANAAHHSISALGGISVWLEAGV